MGILRGWHFCHVNNSLAWRKGSALCSRIRALNSLLMPLSSLFFFLTFFYCIMSIILSLNNLWFYNVNQNFLVCSNPIWTILRDKYLVLGCTWVCWIGVFYCSIWGIYFPLLELTLHQSLLVHLIWFLSYSPGY